jgi:hypothetical protein
MVTPLFLFSVNAPELFLRLPVSPREKKSTISSFLEFSPSLFNNGKLEQPPSVTGYWLLTTLLFRNGGVPLARYPENKASWPSNATGSLQRRRRNAFRNFRRLLAHPECRLSHLYQNNCLKFALI